MSIKPSPELPTSVRGAVESRLEPDEVIWYAVQPDPKSLMISDWMSWLVGILILGFSVVSLHFVFELERSLAKLKGENSPPEIHLEPRIFGYGIMLGGVGMFFMPAWQRWCVKRSAYVITNRQAIILRQGYFVPKYFFYPPGALQNARREQKPDGSGDLIFRDDSPLGLVWFWYHFYRGQGFAGLARVAEAHEALRRLTG